MAVNADRKQDFQFCEENDREFRSRKAESSENSTCKPENIRELSENDQRNEDFIKLKEKIEQLEHKSNEKLAKIRNNRKECKYMYDKVLEDIRKFRTDINTYLDKAEAKIKSEVEELMSANDNILDRLEDNFKKFTSQVHKENLLFIEAVLSTKRVSETEREQCKYEESECDVKRFNFVADQQLCKIITDSAEKLGELQILDREMVDKHEVKEQPVDYEKDDKKSDARQIDVGGGSVNYAPGKQKSKGPSKQKRPCAYVSYHSIPRDLAYCKKVCRRLNGAIYHAPGKQMPIVVVCLQKTRPIEDLDGALTDFTADELPRLYFVYITTDDQYFLKKEEIPEYGRYGRYAKIAEIYNYSTKSKDKKGVIYKLREDLASRESTE